MSGFQGSDRRQHTRYDTEIEIKFHVNFDLETKINFKLKKGAGGGHSSETYTAVGRNINVEGLCFCSSRKLKKGDQLIMDVFVPSAQQPIRMEGRARWCAPSKKKKGQYETGVKILKVQGEDVEKSISVDPAHNILWSIVLESVFGAFKENILKVKKSK